MLKHFGCLSLSTASIGIGWIGGAFSLMCIFVLLPALNNIQLLADIFNTLITKSIGIRGLTILVSLGIASHVVNLIASVMLIVGAIRHQHLYLLPWLINIAFSVFMSVMYWLYLVFGLLIHMKYAAIVTIPSTSLGVILLMTVWYIVLSFYKELQQEHRATHNKNNNYQQQRERELQIIDMKAHSELF